MNPHSAAAARSPRSLPASLPASPVPRRLCLYERGWRFRVKLPSLTTAQHPAAWICRLHDGSLGHRKKGRAAPLEQWGRLPRQDLLGGRAGRLVWFSGLTIQPSGSRIRVALRASRRPGPVCARDITGVCVPCRDAPESAPAGRLAHGRGPPGRLRGRLHPGVHGLEQLEQADGPEDLRVPDVPALCVCVRARARENTRKGNERGARGLCVYAWRVPKVRQGGRGKGSGRRVEGGG